MQTYWKVIFRQDGRLRLKRFRADLSSAVTFYKEKRRDGLEVHLVSANRGFPPFKPGHARFEEKPSPKHIWCPYCLKYRLFVYSAIRDKDGQLTSPSNRCPICTIPIYDYHVRRFNGMADHVDMEALKKSVGAW